MKSYDALWRVGWPDYKGNPPAGKKRTLAEVIIEDWPNKSVEERRAPEILEAKCKENPDYCLYWAPILPPRKLMSKEAKAKIRKQRLLTRMKKKFPLFAETFTQDELNQDPAYFDAETTRRRRQSK